MRLASSRPSSKRCSPERVRTLRLRTLALLVLPWLGAGLPAGPASALDIVPNPVPFAVDGLVGQIELVEVVSGLPASGVVLEGSVDAGDTTLVFRGSLDGSSAPALAFAVGVATSGATAPDVAFHGIGWIPGAGVDILAVATLAGAEAAFGGAFGPGSVSDLFFVAYPAGSLAPGLRQLAGATADLSEPIVAFAEAVFVPEPGTAALVLAGLLGLAAGRRAN